ncbi:helicase ATP-binding domain-containing protein, partial [Haematococcus lacustris]
MEGLSARERNRLKRKAKAMARNDGSGPASSRHHAGPHPSTSSRTLSHPGSSSSTLPPSHSGPDASGLVDSATLAAAAAANKGWLEECVVLLLCVLALDRFSDFGSDQVTAPVRETAAQALGMALTTVDMDTVQAVRVLLEQLQRQPEWDVRYGGYLGLKYLLAARLRDCKQLLPLALPVLIAGLQDADDDVRAASADALVPMASELTSQGIATIRHIQGLLWDLLGQ